MINIGKGTFGKKALFSLILAFMIIIGVLIIHSGYFILKVRATTITNSPSSYEENSQWSDITYAYNNDGNSAYEGTPYETVTYKDFGFQNNISSGDTINSVKVWADGKVTSGSTQYIRGQVSWDGGSSWSTNTNFGFGSSYSNKSIDVSSATSWNRDKLNDTNFRVKLEYGSTGGCYPNGTYFLSFDKKQNIWILKNVAKAKVGDPILVLDHYTREIFLSEISTIEIHYGTWTILDIWSGELTITKEELKSDEDWTWYSHNKFTDEHPSAYYIDPDGEEKLGLMKDLKIGYYLSHMWHDPPYFRNTPVPLNENYVKLFPITRIDSEVVKTSVYNLVAEEPYYRPFLKLLTDDEMKTLIQIGEKLGVGLEMLFDPPPSTKTTGYVDWLRVEVSFTDSAPSYNIVGSDGANAGMIATLYCKWSDNNGLSHYKFEHNNTGSWYNTTAAFNGNDWSNMTLILNDSVDIVVAWRVHANDTIDQWNHTSWLHITTTSGRFYISNRSILFPSKGNSNIRFNSSILPKRFSTLYRDTNTRWHFNAYWFRTTIDMTIDIWFQSDWLNYTANSGTAEIYLGVKPTSIYFNDVQQQENVAWSFSNGVVSITTSSSGTSVGIYGSQKGQKDGI